MAVQDYVYIAVCITIAGLCAVYGCVAHKCRAWGQRERRDHDREEPMKQRDSDDDWSGDCLFDQADACEQGLALHPRHHDSVDRDA